MKRYMILPFFLLILTACGDQPINRVITQEITTPENFQNVENPDHTDKLYSPQIDYEIKIGSFALIQEHADFGEEILFIRALAYNGTDLYAICQYDTGKFIGTRQRLQHGLYKINLTNLTATRIGTEIKFGITGYYGVTAHDMAFVGNTLYAVISLLRRHNDASSDLGLYTMNLETGNATRVGTGDPHVISIACVGSILYGVSRKAYYTIDLTSGEGTVVEKDLAIGGWTTTWTGVTAIGDTFYFAGNEQVRSFRPPTENKLVSPLKSGTFFPFGIEAVGNEIYISHEAGLYKSIAANP